MKKVSFAQFAGIIGSDPKEVTKAVQSGRLKVHLSTTGKRYLVLDEARRDWEKNRSQSPTRKKKTEQPAQAPVEKTEPSSPPVTQVEGELSLTDYRTKSEKFKAAQAELEYNKTLGELVSAEDALKKWSHIISIARTKILGVASKCRQRIPELTNEQVGVIELIVRESLEDLADADG